MRHIRKKPEGTRFVIDAGSYEHRAMRGMASFEVPPPRYRRKMLTQAPANETQVMDPLANFIGEIKPSKSKGRSSAQAGSRRKQYVSEMEQRIKERNWEGFTPGMLVALYWCSHVMVYGVSPAELDKATTWTTAMKCAGKLVKDQFDGDVQTAIKFMRWAWTREREREEWRRRNDKPGRRLTWQSVFCYVSLVSDWRAEKVRKGA